MSSFIQQKTIGQAGPYVYRVTYTGENDGNTHKWEYLGLAGHVDPRRVAEDLDADPLTDDEIDVQPHSTRTEQKTHEKLLDEYRTEPDPTEQSTLVTDGGQQMARPRTIYCRECNSIHPADAAHKPWGVTDE